MLGEVQPLADLSVGQLRGQQREHAQQEEGDQVRVEVVGAGGTLVAVEEALEPLAGEQGEIAFTGCQRGPVPVNGC